MAEIPQKQIIDMYYRSRNNPGKWISGGRAYEMYTFPDGRVKLTHYGTVIYRADPRTGEYEIGGWSESDRNAINSLAYMTGIGGAKIRDRKLRPYGRGHKQLNFNFASRKAGNKTSKIGIWGRKR